MTTVTETIIDRLRDAWDELDPSVGSGRDLRAFLMQEMTGNGISSFLSFAGFDPKDQRAEDSTVLGKGDPVWTRRFKLYVRFPEADSEGRSYEEVMQLAEYFEDQKNADFTINSINYSIIIRGGTAIGDSDLSIDAFEVDIEVV